MKLTGFFFLDEVHYLSSLRRKPGKLFLFMDKDYFYLLGDKC
ncbi:hypothetical protein [Sodalis-like endosymbiont of Proechinophthirus fluctus]|nr:hypothetical protein [Sodalis-like endosymbiont of Proechinophthirus fluctus]